MRRPLMAGLSVAFAVFGLVLPPPASAQVMRPTERITPGTLEALSSLTESRSGFLSWSYGPPPDDSAPAPFAVKLVPAAGLSQTINVYEGPPPDDSAPPVLALIVSLPPPDDSQPPPDDGAPSFLVQVFDAAAANRLFRQIADPTGGTFCPEPAPRSPLTASAQVVTPTKPITAGTLEALSSLTESRSGFLSWTYQPPPDDDAPAPFAVKLVPALGLRQTINVYEIPPPDDGAPPVLALIVSLPPPDDDTPPSFLIQVFDAEAANRLFRQIADPTGGTFCPELAPPR